MTRSRRIFEDVGTKPVSPQPTTVGRKRYARRGIATWLCALFVLVAVMIIIGGMTRLTDAGLAITEWRPVTGALPPLGEAAWSAEFERYRAIPQYALVNPDMTLGQFKVIYWWEWGHRQLGRLIGAVWAGGFLGFLVARRIPPGWTPRLLVLGLLGGVQGAVGWWMVTSGLEAEMVRVASYRLAVHLGLAFVILGLIAWHVLTLRREEADLLQARRQRNPALVAWGTTLIVLVYGQIVLGALVAGIDAGQSYVDWPLMAGEVFPSGAFSLRPLWTNVSDNPALVQFNHRALGYLIVVFCLVAWWRSRSSSSRQLRRAFDVMLAGLAVQVILGVVTVLHAAPWHLAILHQFGAIVLTVLVIAARFAALYPRHDQIGRG